MIHFRNQSCRVIHVVDEFTPVDQFGFPRTLCGRATDRGKMYESHEWPTCKHCSQALRKLRRQTRPAVSLRDAPKEITRGTDLLCPVCGRQMDLDARKTSFSARHPGSVLVALHMSCSNQEGHPPPPGPPQEPPDGPQDEPDPLVGPWPKPVRKSQPRGALRVSGRKKGRR